MQKPGFMPINILVQYLEQYQKDQNLEKLKNM